MHSQSQEDLFESMLKAAVMENSLEELEEYPPDSELDQIQIPERLDKHMHKIIRKHTFREKTKHILHFVRKGVSTAMIILGASFAALLFSQDIRAACMDVIVRIYERYIEFDASGSEVSVQPIQLNYVPEGYSLDGIEYFKLYTICTYTNDNQDIITFSYGDSPIISQVDNENYNILSININGSDGKLFISNNELFPNTLIWYNDLGYFELISVLDEAEMKKMAQSIK